MASPNPPIPLTMKGLWISEYNKPYQYRTDIPSPPTDQPNNMIVAIRAAGFCHTELLALSGAFGSAPGFVPGHEPCGVVVHVGANVTKFKPGDRVGCGLFRNACGTCRECTVLHTNNYCSKVALGGLTADGAMAQYYLADPEWAVRLPEGMSFTVAAPLMCAGSTIYNSLLRAGLEDARVKNKGLKTEAVVAIVGLGGLGHLGVQFAKAMGYGVVAVDARAAPLELVMDETVPAHLRPDVVVNSLEETPAQASKRIEEVFGRTGVDAALVATDALPAFAWSKGIIEKHGTLVYIGQPNEPVPFHYLDFISQDLTVRAGCLGQPAVVQEMVDLVQREGIVVHTTVFKPEQIEELMKAYHEPGMKGKFVIDFE